MLPAYKVSCKESYPQLEIDHWADLADLMDFTYRNETDREPKGLAVEQAPFNLSPWFDGLCPALFSVLSVRHY